MEAAFYPPKNTKKVSFIVLDCKKIGYIFALGFFIALSFLLISTPALSAQDSEFELWVVNLQSIVDRAPGMESLRQKLIYARKEAQAQIDRQRLEVAGQQANWSKKQIEAQHKQVQEMALEAERKLEAMEAEMLAPILDDLMRFVAEAETSERKIVREDQVPLIGWPKACDLTEWLFDKYRNKKPTSGSIAANPRCRMTAFWVVDVNRLAVKSPKARQAASRLEQFRVSQQSELDRARKEVEALERAATTKAEQRAASAARTRLHEQALMMADSMRTRAEVEEERVFSWMMTRLSKEAQKLSGIAVVESGSANLPGSAVKAQSWARQALGWSR